MTQPALAVRRLALASIGVGAVVFAIKLGAWWITGSVALLSDALESTVNIGAAAATWLAVRWSAIPEDESHPYGHHKAEYLSAVLEGVLIAVAALLILREAVSALVDPRVIAAPWLGLAINGAAGVLNAVWALVLMRYGRRHRSPAVAADGRHLAADTVSSVGVIAGLSLAVVTGWSVLDPICALLVGLHVLWSGYVLMRESVGGLMDEAAPENEQERICAAIGEHAQGAIEAHDLRTRHAGRRTFVDFHLVVPSDMTVAAAHEICDRIERGIRAEIGEALINIHVEPQHKAKHGNGADGAGVRGGPDEAATPVPTHATGT
jgi:cation diffusion facilitator family transporter